jgi:hypothetical protein
MWAATVKDFASVHDQRLLREGQAATQQRDGREKA